MSCMVNFLASVYMAEKKNMMSMVTALAGAVTNVALNLVLIPKMGANGAAIATAVSFVVVFVARVIDTRKYIKIAINPLLLISQFVLLIIQGAVMLHFKSGLLMYGIEAVLFCLMLVLNFKPIKELAQLLIEKFLKRGKKS